MINRKELINRHNPLLSKYDYKSPFSLGNGSFAFTADITGLQSFPEQYLENGIPLCTQSNWGWHSFPNPDNLKVEDALVNQTVGDRDIPYLNDMESPAGQWFRNNPHLLELARIGFEITNGDGTNVQLEDIKVIAQHLDMWNGVLSSRFVVNGEEVSCQTTCHPDIDQIAIKVISPLIKSGQLKIHFCFPYGSIGFRIGSEEWLQPDKHQSIEKSKPTRIEIQRILDEHSHNLCISSDPAEFEKNANHDYYLIPKPKDEFECCVTFSKNPFSENLPNFNDTLNASKKSWNNFWQSGAAIDFSACTDIRAPELERRIVLSQYLTAIQCTGDTPPQETGLTCNSWHGKFHLEMHWWHGVHFAYWGRLSMLEKTLIWYQKIIPEARKNAERQGYEGIRWPKQVASDGIDSPSTCGPLLIWQQAHPIYYAELCYREHKNKETLEKYSEIVFETAAFMSSYARWDEEYHRYVLGPTMIPAQECYDYKVTFNPPFELAYWHWGLSTAIKWRERLGLEVISKWEHVLEHLSNPPVSKDTYETAQGQWKTADHPSLLGAFGILPGNNIDKKIMHNTLKKVIKEWQWDKTWGWDFPMVAMCAARLREPEIALDYLLKETKKNQYCVNGHNYQSHVLPLYLPGNGGLLTAVAMMAAGWDGCDNIVNPGFPNNGQWQVESEGLKIKI
jgi:protein-glucosylgalactosylhydroxylysine glucosidase